MIPTPLIVAAVFALAAAIIGARKLFRGLKPRQPYMRCEVCGGIIPPGEVFAHRFKTSCVQLRSQPMSGDCNEKNRAAGICFRPPGMPRNVFSNLQDGHEPAATVACSHSCLTERHAGGSL